MVDFMKRIKHHESTYTKITTKEMDDLSPTSVPFIQLVNIGTQVSNVTYCFCCLSTRILLIHVNVGTPESHTRIVCSVDAIYNV